MTKTTIRSALIGIAAVALLPAIAAAQTPSKPAAKPPVAAERKVEQRQGKPDQATTTKAKADQAKRDHTDGRRDVADRGADRRSDRCIDHGIVRRARIGRTECVNVGHFRAGRTPFALSW